MKTVGAYEAKTHLSGLLDQVEQGEEITITRHGRPIAKLVPAAMRPNPETVRQAIDDIRALSRGKHATREEILEWINEGRRY
jgi:prevent-host-death family protein